VSTVLDNYFSAVASTYCLTITRTTSAPIKKQLSSTSKSNIKHPKPKKIQNRLLGMQLESKLVAPSRKLKIMVGF
jgi:hypothetical protein